MTRSGEYALRAVVFLASHQDDWPIPGREIANGSRVPAKYLQKILGDLTRCGALESSPGRTGGFRLRRASGRISILEVVAPFERFRARTRPFGHKVCSDRTPCKAHHKWKRVVETEQRFFRETTVEDVTEICGVDRRKRIRARLAK